MRPDTRVIKQDVFFMCSLNVFCRGGIKLIVAMEIYECVTNITKLPMLLTK